MTAKLDHETLLAYADGELTAAEAERVERHLADDAEARATVASLREGRALLQGAYNEALTSPVPDKVQAAIDNALADHGRRGGLRGTAPAWMPLALAASIATVVVGAPAGYFLADRAIDAKLARLEALHRGDRQALEAAIDQGLERNVSGLEVAWHNPDSGSQGTVTPLRTFKNAEGKWCREYVAASEMDAQKETRRAIACRTGEGRWQTRVQMISDS